jgi:prolyl-tRNA editing enzyme YbaK/EbsC (Cys-tRNA(Pro) deacylase)
VACVVLASTRLDVNGAVRKKLGAKRSSFADADTTAEITGMAIGGVTVIGLPDDLPIWVDSKVMDRERIVLGGGSRSCKVLAPPAVLRALPNVEVVEGLSL